MTFSPDERAELIAALRRTAEMVGLLLDDPGFQLVGPREAAATAAAD